MRRFRLYIIVGCLICACPALALADARTGDFTCEKATVKVASPTKILLVCTSNWPASTPTVEIWLFPDRKDPRVSPVNITGNSRVLPSTDGGRSFAIQLDQPLAGDQKYVIALISPPKNDSSTAKVDKFMELLTDPKATISSSLAAIDRGRVFTVDSPIAFQNSPNAQLIERREKPLEPSDMGVVHDAKIEISSQNPACSDDDPDCIGRVSATLDSSRRLRQAKATVGIKNLTNIFGQPVAVENQVDASSPPPKGKDDAAQYYQISHKAGRGAKPSVAINIKATTLPGVVSSFWIGDFLAQPDIVFDVGTNEFARKSDDTIRLGMLTTKTFLSSFGQIIYGPGVTYETNLGFKKNNLVGNFESRFIPVNAFRTREMRRYDRAARDKALSIDDIPSSAYKFGAGLEFFLGLEAGGSLREQTFQNKAKTATLGVPQYGIFRFRPRVHTFIEYDRLTLDWSGTLRVLGRTEFVGEEQPDKSVNLRRVRGARGYMETTLSFGLDRSKHLNLAITYKRGSQPPNFTHTNNVVTGFIIKY